MLRHYETPRQNLHYTYIALDDSCRHYFRIGYHSSRRQVGNNFARVVLANAQHDLSRFLQSIHLVGMYFLFSIAVCFLWILSCLGLGVLGANAFFLFAGSAHETTKNITEYRIKIATTFLAGLALYSAILTFMGLAGLLKLYPISVIMLPGLAGLFYARHEVKTCAIALHRYLLEWKPESPWLKTIAIANLLLAIGIATGAWLLPPKGDAAGFYLVYPKILASTGVLEPMHGPFYTFSTIGLPVELHYAALMILADVHAAKLIMFPIALTVGVFLSSIVKLCGGGRLASTLGWALLLSSYTFYHYSFDGKVDNVAAAFGLSAIYWLLRYKHSDSSIWLYALAGWLAGLATAAKFSYLLVLGVCMLVLLSWQVSFRSDSGSRLSFPVGNIFLTGSIMAMATVIAWIPQILKNMMLFNAPLAPFIGMESDANFIEQVWFAPEVTLKILLTYPLALVFGRYPMQGGGLSFLFIAFAPFLFWMARPENWTRSLTTAVTFSSIAAVIAWMLLRPSIIAPRYILAPLLLLIPVIVIAVENTLLQSTKHTLLRTSVVTSCLLAITASFWHLLPIPGAMAASIKGNDTTCLLASTECQTMHQLSTTALPGERVLLATYYTYWLTPALLQCRDTPQEQQDLLQDGSSLVFWLQSHDFSYVVVDPTVSASLDKRLQVLASDPTSGVSSVSANTTVNSYHIPQSGSSFIRCLETTPGRWQLQDTRP